MAGLIFTAYRRDLVARTSFDLLKITVAAAFASKFFFEFSWPVKLSLTGVMFTFGLLGFLLCPKKAPKEEA